MPTSGQAVVISMFDINNCVTFAVLMAAAFIFRVEARTWLFLAKRAAI